MATQYAISDTPGTDLDAQCNALEMELGILNAWVVGSWESDQRAHDGGAYRMDGTVAIRIFATDDASIVNALASVGGLTKVTNALASADAE